MINFPAGGDVIDEEAEARQSSQYIHDYRNRMLELVARNEAVESTLKEMACLAGFASRGSCTVYLVENGQLLCAAAPGFDPAFAEDFNRCAPAARTLFLARDFEDAAACPLWTKSIFRRHLSQFSSCLIAPINSGKGFLLGIWVLHYRYASLLHAEHRNVADFASRLAAIAIEQRQLVDRLALQARYDSLTGLPNRSYFLERLEAALSGARQRSALLGVLFIDLDRFKQINETLGHAMGDRLLAEVGERLRGLTGAGDLAGRMGGDEFTIVLASPPDEDGIVNAGWAILDALRAPYLVDGHEVFVTASIGVGVYPKDGTEVSQLLRSADLAMYRAKRSGNNDVQVSVVENEPARVERLQLESALRRALEHREFELLYQPLVGMDGALSGLEALLSWTHPTRGKIAPKDFIPIAEETGLIIPIGTWVIRQACMQGARWRKSGYSTVRISVNVSALQFERADFVETVAAALLLSRFPPGGLVLELTESFVMRDIQESASRMERLRELGVSISIDDFGTGYSSLNYLNKLPADSLKIDQSFVRNIQDPSGSLPLVQTIVRLAHNMNLSVVAEGVETAEELDILRVLGCDNVQGHLYGRPLRERDAEALLASGGGPAPLQPMDRAEPPLDS